ncbi:hypothetical protein GE061_019207 [Apolygus lucorum]|uniref:Uncharacterized protein n=1 Tax=Apolygus lucorum TaxID=248454 RepID=A0A8S9X7F4_APOLU|nr:hypothetical protein GE061_019207 [Apolygus lucorum]
MDWPVGWEEGSDLDDTDDCEEEENAPSPLVFPPGVGERNDVDCEGEDDEDDEDYGGAEDVDYVTWGQEEENLDCLNVSGEGFDYQYEEEDEYPVPRAAFLTTKDWTPLPQYSERRIETPVYDPKRKWRNYRTRFRNARLQCGGTPSGYTTVQPFGFTEGYPTAVARPLSERVSRRIDFSTASGKPRNPLRYIKKRFNEGLSRLRGVREPPIPHYENGCDACGGPRRCHIGIEEQVDPYCNPRIKSPKWPDFDSPGDWPTYVRMYKTFKDGERYGDYA